MFEEILCTCNIFHWRFCTDSQKQIPMSMSALHLCSSLYLLWPFQWVICWIKASSLTVSSAITTNWLTHLPRPSLGLMLCFLLPPDVGSVEGLAYHRGWNMLYWTSYTTSTITRHTVDKRRWGGVDRHTVVTMSGDDHPRAFVLDECQRLEHTELFINNSTIKC